MLSLLPTGQGVTAGLAPWGRGGDAEAGSTSTCSTQGQHGDRRRLDAPDEGGCSRDRFATMVLSPSPGKGLTPCSGTASPTCAQNCCCPQIPAGVQPPPWRDAQAPAAGCQERRCPLHPPQPGLLPRGCPGGLGNSQGTLVPAPLRGTEAVCSTHRHRGVSEPRDGGRVLLLFLRCHQ